MPQQECAINICPGFEGQVCGSENNVNQPAGHTFNLRNSTGAHTLTPEGRQAKVAQLVSY